MFNELLGRAFPVSGSEVARNGDERRIFMTRFSPEPHLGLVASVVGNGKRFRQVSNELYPRPANETFHEFLTNVVKWTFGKEWWLQQVALPTHSQHIIIPWTKVWAANSRRPPLETANTDVGTRFAVRGSAPTKALLALGYDLYCLQAKDKLPVAMVERLRDRRRFQSVRYEIAVAATMLRAGFDLQMLDDDTLKSKHCEFIAIHRVTGLRAAVEAKSRVRPGALHERGQFTYQEDAKGLANLVRRASKQGFPNMPLIIFVDVNLPPTPGVDPHNKRWVRDANAVADEFDRRALQSEGSPAKYSLLMMTNFGFQFGDTDGVAAPVEAGAILPEHPSVQLPANIVGTIVASTGQYGRIPDEV